MNSCLLHKLQLLATNNFTFNVCLKIAIFEIIKIHPRLLLYAFFFFFVPKIANRVPAVSFKRIHKRTQTSIFISTRSPFFCGANCRKGLSLIFYYNISVFFSLSHYFSFSVTTFWSHRETRHPLSSKYSASM